MAIRAQSIAPFRRRKHTLAVLLNCALVLICAVMLFPIASTLVLSLKREADVHRQPPLLLPCDTATASFDIAACRFVAEGYARVLLLRESTTAPGFRIEGRIWTTYLPNTILYASSSAALVTLLAALSAYAYSRFRFRGRRALLVGTLLVSGVPLLTMLLALLQVGNALRRTLPGFDDRVFMIVVYIGFELPFAIWIAKSFFDSIPRELEQAALIDGATPLGALGRIVVPLAAPGLFSVFLLSFVQVWNDFTLNYFLINQQAFRGAIYGVYDYIAASGISYNALAAACVTVALPVVVVFLFARRVFFLAMLEGAVKG
ncbi:MAG: carbohydrate ABC transporter permease [Roseiflexaceae bacterium]|nr:carbohydrate ABC transporter permease [Roseiflexaceae bacterium]